MKKLILFAVAALAMVGCSEQSKVRNFGGTMEMKVPKGQKLMMATWKNEDLFTLTEPMEEGYVPKRKTFSESSSYGLIETTIVFIEEK